MTDQFLESMERRLAHIETMVAHQVPSPNPSRLTDIEKAIQAIAGQVSDLKNKVDTQAPSKALTKSQICDLADSQIMQRVPAIAQPIVNELVNKSREANRHTDTAIAGVQRDASVARSAAASVAEASGDWLRNLALRFGR